jgi:hypothetical protein
MWRATDGYICPRLPDRLPDILWRVVLPDTRCFDIYKV